MTFKSPTRPHCRYCGKPIKKLIRRVWISRRRPNTKNHLTSSEYMREIEVDELPKTAEECARLTNNKVVWTKRSFRGDEDGIGMFGEWDGESWTDEFFCTGTHAQAMGYLLCRQYGYGTDKYRKATGK